MNLIYHFTFFIVSLFILIKVISYGLYEYHTENNKLGSIAVICFSSLTIIFTNIVVFFR